jgi:uncharacterized membrane protein
MKRILLMALPVIALALLSFTGNPDGDVKTNSLNIDTPENVQAVLDKSCVMCHNTASKNMKGKAKLNFDKFKEGYKPHKKIAKLMEIAEEVKENSMPPKKFNQKHPDKKLTAEERELLYKWAEAEAKKLSE